MKKPQLCACCSAGNLVPVHFYRCRKNVLPQLNKETLNVKLVLQVIYVL